MFLNSGDPWIHSHDGLESQFRDIMEFITQRNRQLRTSLAYSQFNVKARTGITKYKSELLQLRDVLNQSKNQITQGESHRRRQLLEVLEHKAVQMDNAFQDRDNANNRDDLFGMGQFGGPGTAVSWNEAESEETRNYSIDELRQQQQTVIEEQDRGLDSLLNIVVRQKNMAQGISNELDFHNELITDITDHTDRTRERLIRETKHVTTVHEKSGTCWYWVIIILLAVAIITIVSV